MAFSFVRSGKYFLVLSALLVATSLVVLFVPGPKLSIEFTGGTLMEVSLPEGKTKDDLDAALHAFTSDSKPLQEISIAKTKTDSYFVRTETLSNDQHKALLSELQKAMPTLAELQYTTIGPTVGATLKSRAIWALFWASVAIILYVAIAFRKIPRQLNPWSFGVSAVIALLHDVILTTGIFTVLSHYTTFQVDSLFISALLSIMGYSVMDTIVIFDRIRENLFVAGKQESFGTLVDSSMYQTLTRTTSTVAVTLILLCALFFFGAESIHWFILTLIVGTVIGTYSSFFIATPLIAYWPRKK